jgi:hypothetical protein
MILVGVAGFAVVFVGVIVASRPASATAVSAKTRPARAGGFMQRMEQQWEDRKEGRG